MAATFEVPEAIFSVVGAKRESSASVCSDITSASALSSELVAAAEASLESTNRDEEVAAVADAPQGQKKKRRCSYLPTAHHKRKVLPGSARKKLATPHVASQPGTPLAPPHQSRTPSRLTQASLESASKRRPGVLDSFVDCDGLPGRLFLCGPPSASKNSVLTGRRSSRCIGKRKKSMAQISAMVSLASPCELPPSLST